MRPYKWPHDWVTGGYFTPIDKWAHLAKIRQFRGLPGGQCFGGKLAESYGKLQDDEALKNWLDTDVVPGSRWGNQPERDDSPGMYLLDCYKKLWWSGSDVRWKAPRYVRWMSMGLKLGWKNFGFSQRLGPAIFRVRWFWANFITNQPPVREMEFAQDFVREVSPKLLDRNLRFRIFLHRLFAQMFFFGCQVLFIFWSQSQQSQSFLNITF